MAIEQLVKKSLFKSLHVYVCCTLIMAGVSHTASAQNTSQFDGVWHLNEKLSDDTDRQVEKAIKAGGGKVRRPKKTGKYYYKGGPEEQELYDHISYDETLQINNNGVEFQFTYLSDEEPGEFLRTFHTDGRSRSVSASSLSGTAERSDFAFGSWEGSRLVVETRVRDGGRTTEIYSLHGGGSQLRIELTVEPLTFLVPVEIIRVFDKVN